MSEKKTYVLIDFMNMAFRAKHSMFNSDVNTQVGLALHTIFNSMRYVYKQAKADHMVVCLEGGKNWRKTAYPKYKLNRVVKQLERNEREVEDDKIFFDAINDFTRYLEEKTNVTCARCVGAEADDMIALFVQAHPDDNHVIISSDSDYYQLLSDNVTIFNGITEQTITLEGFFDKRGRPVKDKKTKLDKEAPDPEYLLFEKCIRGDTSDNVFSAYPGVRKKGSKNKVGILEAFADRNNKGYDYNNFMLQTWTDAEGQEQRVLDRYLENKTLIDLTAQPTEIRTACEIALAEALSKEPVKNVGVHFLRFCDSYDLNRISQYPDEFANILNRPYTLNKG